MYIDKGGIINHNNNYPNDENHSIGEHTLFENDYSRECIGFGHGTDDKNNLIFIVYQNNKFSRKYIIYIGVVQN